MAYIVIALKEGRKNRLGKGYTMEYTKTFDTEFPFWAGADAKVGKLDMEGRAALTEHIESVFEDCTPSETDINDYVWFELCCAVTCHGAPQAGCEYVFWSCCEDMPGELELEIANGYAHLIFD